MAVSWLVMWAAMASGGDFYLEGPPATSRTEASAQAKAAEGTGHTARVVRRFREGRGWEYVMVVEGFDSQDAAAETAQALAQETGRGFRVFATEGRVAREVDAILPDPGRRVAVPAPEPPAAADAAAPAPEPRAPDSDAARLLAGAAHALGGPTGGAAAIAGADAVLFRYRRAVPDGPVVVHTWARKGAAIYLAVEVESGVGSPSRTWWSPEGAWLAVGDGAPVAQDPTRTADLLDRLGPARVLSFPLGFASALETRRELSLLYDAGIAQVDGVTCRRFRYDGDRVTGPVEICLDAGDLLPRQVRFGGGSTETVHDYTDYRKATDSVVLPFRARISNGTATVDAIDVLELDLSPRLDEAWFRSPR